MRKTRIGALLASTALASTTILGGAAVANASTEDVLGSLDVGGSIFGEADVAVPQAVDTATIVAYSTGIVEEGEETDGDPRYTLSATAYDNCTVEFTLEDQWEEYGGPDHEGLPGWRADYRVGDEEAVMAAGSSRGGPTYRPVLGGNQGIADAIAGRDNPYDFAANEVTVDLTEERLLPAGEHPYVENTTRPGVEANATGEHIISFGMYQGPNTAGSGQYSIDSTVVVTGCPIVEDEDEDSSGPLGSLDVFGSLSS